MTGLTRERLRNLPSAITSEVGASAGFWKPGRVAIFAHCLLLTCRVVAPTATSYDAYNSLGARKRPLWGRGFRDSSMGLGEGNGHSVSGNDFTMVRPAPVEDAVD